MTRKLKVDATGIEPWKMHIYQAIYIIIIIALPFIFQDVIWLSLVPFYLGIFECFVHILGIKIMDMKKPYSPGMITAIIMAIPSFYGIWFLKTQNLVFGYEWIYALLVFLVGFIIMQQLILRTVLNIHDMHEAANNVFRE